MRKAILFILIVIIGTVCVSAQKQAEIKFDKTTHDFGFFDEKHPKQTCTFKFTNTGDDLLVINQVVSSCGCTIPEYAKEPVKPGESGEIKVTYNGAGRHPGHFKKYITIRSNAKTAMVRLQVEGSMASNDGNTGATRR